MKVIIMLDYFVSTVVLGFIFKLQRIRIFYKKYSNTEN